MNIAIIGYGKMGHEIAAIAKERGHSIILTIDIDNASDLNAQKLRNVDVAIEFSSPKSAFSNIIACLKSLLMLIDKVKSMVFIVLLTIPK
jgi:4-hydroxy-tetrahydrodipicolinate reductase